MNNCEEKCKIMESAVRDYLKSVGAECLSTIDRRPDLDENAVYEDARRAAADYVRSVVTRGMQDILPELRRGE